jgi:hypothetical protein
MEQISAMRNAARLQAFSALIIACTGERKMRKYLLAAAAVAALAAVPTAASAQYYYDGYAPPGAVYVNPPAVYAAPPMAQSQVYLAPTQPYVAPGTEFQDGAVYVDGQRYYRDCWWDWGQRRCDLKPWR